MRFLWFVLLSWLLIVPTEVSADKPPQGDPQAVQEVLDGKRDTANAAWWGFDPDDATEALQGAIDSGAKKVIVPDIGSDWIVRPIQLAGDQELVLEKGAVITAKRGEYRGRGDSVFTGRNISNFTLRGYGATVRMQKEDYIVGIVLKDFGWNRWFGQYEKAEWRMALSLRGCSNVNVYGVTLRDSGGDGIYIGDGKQGYCKNIHIKDVNCDNNYRQGISIISVDGLLVEDSVFQNTWGTPPSSGVDIEPDAPDQKVKDILFRNCRFVDNYGDGIEVFLSHQDKTSDDISILFDNCSVSSRRGPGIRVTKIVDDGPQGLVEFRNCTVEGTEAYGIKVQDKSPKSARVRFVGCTLRDVARNRNYEGMWAPIWLHPFRPQRVATFGGIDFIDCRLEDRHNRPAISVAEGYEDNPFADITGTIEVKNANGTKMHLGNNADEITLTLKPIE